jgi:uncharacterized protein VirK/YbjX
MPSFLNVYEDAAAARMMRRSFPMGESKSWSFQPSDNASMEFSLRSSRIASGDSNVLLELSKRLGVIGRLLILVNRRRLWSPFRVFGELFQLVTNIGMQREIFRLLELQPFAEIVQENPELPFKYLIPDYVVRGFTVTERASLFLHHYKRIHSALPEDVLRGVLQREVILHEIAKEGNRFAVTLSLSRYPFEKEGELSLSLEVDGKKVFNLSFTIVPGWVLKSEAPEALLISRLQGIPGCNSQIKLARKAFNEYSARSLLLSALQGIADALGVDEIAAVCATNQRCYSEKRAALFKSGYDGFFTKAGMVKTPVGFYSSPIPIEGKPLVLFKGHARSRARKRRANRQQIRSACADFLLEITGFAADSASGTLCLTAVPAAVESGLSHVSFSTSDYNRTP